MTKLQSYIRCCSKQYYCSITAVTLKQNLLTISDFTRTTQAGLERPPHSVFQPLPAALVPCCTHWATQHHNYINGAASLKGNGTKFKNLNGVNVLPVVCSSSLRVQQDRQHKEREKRRKYKTSAIKLAWKFRFFSTDNKWGFLYLLEMLECALSQSCSVSQDKLKTFLADSEPWHDACCTIPERRW